MPTAFIVFISFSFCNGLTLRDVSSKNANTKYYLVLAAPADRLFMCRQVNGTVIRFCNKRRSTCGVCTAENKIYDNCHCNKTSLTLLMLLWCSSDVVIVFHAHSGRIFS